MSKKIMIPGIVGLVIGIIATAVTLSTIQWSRPMANRIPIESPGRQSAEIDSHFIEQMIPHHEDAIIMANLAMTRGQHPELKELANNILKTQSAEINQMKQWYELWFGKKVVSIDSLMGHGGGVMMHGGMMGSEADSKALENATSFDKEFIEQMIPHHQMAVMMAQMLSRTTSRPEMKKLAQDIISTQTKEIDQMREWYRVWYSK